MPAAGELAVADDVPVAVQQVALLVAIGVAVARRRGLVVALHLQQGVGRGKGRLVGRRVVRMGRQEALQHAPGPPHQVDPVDLLLAELGVFTRRGGLGVDPLGQGVAGRGHVGLRRILLQEPPHHVHAPQKLALAVQEARHPALAEEAALDRRPEDQVAPLVLAQVVVRRGDLHDLGKRDLLGGPLLLDDLEVADDLGGRAELQVDVQEHLHRVLVDLAAEVSTCPPARSGGPARSCSRASGRAACPARRAPAASARTCPPRSPLAAAPPAA